MIPEVIVIIIVLLFVYFGNLHGYTHLEQMGIIFGACVVALGFIWLLYGRRRKF